MLGKLFKHDMIATSRYFIPTFLAFAIISIINKITFEVGIISNKGGQFVEISSIILMSLYILCMIAMYILIYVFITMHFYQTMSGEQGYLTHTLPVKSITIINSKLLSAVVWQLAGGVLVIASLLLLAAGHMDNVDFKLFMYRMMEIYAEISGSFTSFCILMLITVALGFISSPLMFYASIALGHLFKKQKLVGSVVSFIAIYVIMQISSVILLIVTGYWQIAKHANELYSSSNTYTSTMLNSFLMAVVYTVIFYIITNWVFSRKLNLE